MSKIVYNGCYGGFGLSDRAIRRYAEIKGITLYPEEVALGSAGFTYTNYWTIPPEGRVGKVIDESEWYSHSLEERAASNKFCSDHQIDHRNIPRNDPVLVQVVEELGREAGSEHADLKIREIVPGTRYRIDEYDGRESVVTVDEDDWSVA